MIRESHSRNRNRDLETVGRLPTSFVKGKTHTQGKKHGSFYLDLQGANTYILQIKQEARPDLPRPGRRRMSEYVEKWDDILEPPERLEPVQPKNRLSATPPPYGPKSVTTGAQYNSVDSAEGARGPRRKGRNQASQGDYVLMINLDPNQPEVAREAGRRPLRSASHSDGSESEDEQMTDVDGAISPVPRSGHPTSEQQSNVLVSQARAAMAETTIQQGDPSKKSLQTSQIATNDGSRTSPRPRTSSGLQSDYDARMTNQRLPPGTPIEMDGEVRDTNIAADGLLQLGGAPADTPMILEESITTSPIISQHLIRPSQIPSTQKLPKLDRVDTIPQQGSAVSPQADALLPPVRNLMVEVDMNDAGVRSNNRTRGSSFGSLGTTPTLSPSMKAKQAFSGPGSPSRYTRPNHTSPGASNDDRSPINMFDGISPASSNSPVASRHPGRRRATSDASSPRYPSLVHSADSGSKSNHSTSTDGQDPNSQLTPGDSRRSLDGRPPITLPHISSSSSSSHADNTGQPGLYRCKFEGCTAAAFQTQYLLNSHANVHSETRPHYCPVKGCSRGEGGRGFKRKNEMIRHGLVHDSPGYVCPYCPDREHKYPRPDNLQRHVRMHHEDMGRDDPKLLEVLSQRPVGGGNRGRRRPRGSMP